MANVIRYNPFSEVVSLRDAMDRLFEDSFISGRSLDARSVTSNLHETADSFVLQVPMPGVNPENVEITTQQDSVILKWSMSVETPENARTHWSGFTSGQYQQSFTLPATINTERAAATYDQGILTLTLPKAEHAKARTIKVTSTQN